MITVLLTIFLVDPGLPSPGVEPSAEGILFGSKLSVVPEPAAESPSSEEYKRFKL